MADHEYSQYNCDERHKEISDFRKENNSKLDHILRLLNGNGTLGLVGKVEVMWRVGLFLAVTVVATGVKVWLF